MKIVESGIVDFFLNDVTSNPSLKIQKLFMLIFAPNGPTNLERNLRAITPRGVVNAFFDNVIPLFSGDVILNDP